MLCAFTGLVLNMLCPDNCEATLFQHFDVSIGIEVTPIHSRAEIIFIYVIHKVLCTKAQEGYSSCPQHSMKVDEQFLVLHTRNVDDSVVRANPVQRLIREVQSGHVLTKEVSIRDIFLGEPDLRF